MAKTCSMCRHSYDGDICMSELCVALRHQRRKQMPAPSPPMDAPPPPDLMAPPPMQQGPQKVTVPNVAELSEDLAVARLEALELVPEFKNTVYSLTLEPKVLRQSPAAGTELAKKKKVTLGVVRRSRQADGETEANKSSSVPKEQLDAFVGALADATDPDLGFPVFSVSDCNSFHTTGYLWGLYAGKRLKKLELPTGPVAVINFDQHYDGGESHGTFVASDRWGRHLVSALHDLGFPACYMSILNGLLAADGSLYAAGGRGKAPKLGRGRTAENLAAFWKKVKDDYFRQAIKYVYVTVDRDCLKDSFTQWGDGGVANVEALKTQMKNVLDPILSTNAELRIGVRRGGENQADTPPPGKLVGFDVTGMPEHESLLGAHCPKLLADNRTKRNPTRGQTPEVFAEAQGISIQALRALNSAAFLDGWDVNDPAPAVTGHVEDFDAMCTKIWELVKLGDLFAFAQERPVPDDSEWSKVLFFSGSAGFGSGNTDFGDAGESSSSDRWDYVSNISRRLPDLLAADWKYALCAQEPPVYKQAWKAFELFAPGAAVRNCADGEAAEEALGAAASKPGGFSCTSSLSHPAAPVQQGWGGSVSVHDMLDAKGDFAK